MSERFDPALDFIAYESEQEASNLCGSDCDLIPLLCEGCPLRVWSSQERLRTLRHAHAETAPEQGKAGWLIEAMWLCMREGLDFPRWVFEAFADGYVEISEFRARTFEAAFGSLFPKSKPLAREKKRKHDFYPVLHSVFYFMKDGMTVETAFRKAGNEFGMSWESVRDWYYEDKNSEESFLADLENSQNEALGGRE